MHEVVLLIIHELWFCDLSSHIWSVMDIRIDHGLQVSGHVKLVAHIWISAVQMVILQAVALVREHSSHLL